MMSPTGHRPNILWLSFEDTSPRFGCFGDALARTPCIDRFAAEGCCYPNTFAVAGVCAPARSAIITGMYPTFIGAHHMRTEHTNPALPELPTPYECVPPHYVRLIPQYLRTAGYYCTNNGKNDYQLTCPLGVWDQHGDHAHWRHRRDPGQPFFAVFNHMKTHESAVWDEYAPAQTRTDPAQVTVPPFLPDTPVVRAVIARQYDQMADTDAWAGELLRQLAADGLAENTIVFVWSDHGEGLPRCKRWPYDSGIRVPMIVRWPGMLPPGHRDQRLVSTLDLGPTILALAGVELPTHLQGRPFVGPAARPREYIYATRDRYDESYDMVRAIRDQRYKYLRNGYPGTPPLATWIPFADRHPAMRELWRLYNQHQLTGPPETLFAPRPAEELYDTLQDPHEVHNLAADPGQAEALQRLRGAMDEHLRLYDRFGAMDERAMVHQWWAGAVQPVTAAVRAVVYGDAGIGRLLDAEIAQDVSPLPALLHLMSPTQGASIVWTSTPGHGGEPGPEANWRIYTGLIRLTEPADMVLHAVAHRLGYKPSPVLRLHLKCVKPDV